MVPYSTVTFDLVNNDVSVTLQPVVNSGTLSTLVSFRGKFSGVSDGSVEMFPLRAQTYVPAHVKQVLASGDAELLERLRVRLLLFFEESKDLVALQDLLTNLHERAQGQNVDATESTERVLLLMNTLKI